MMSLNSDPSTKIDTAMPIRTASQNGAPSIHRRENEKRRQHDEFALGEIDRLRRLPQQRKADGDQRIDRAGRQTGHQKLDEGSHRRPPFWLPPGVGAGRKSLR